MSRNSLCQKVLLQRPWLVSLGSKMNVPQVYLTKVIQAEEGNQPGWPAAEHCAGMATPEQHPAGLLLPAQLHQLPLLCRTPLPPPHLQRHPHTKLLLAVPVSFRAGSADTELAPAFPGLLFKALLAPDWPLYPCMETRQNETMRLMLGERILKRWKVLGDAQMLSRWKLCFFGLFPGL